jgi:hypothetical protein
MEQPPSESPPERRRGADGGVFWGLVILAVGVYFLLRETLELDVPDIGRLWPIFIVALGAWLVYQQWGRR